MSVHSKLTAQGQISVPAEVRRKLGLGPGSVIEWEERDGEYVVRPVGRTTSLEIHEEIFGSAGSSGRPPADVRQGITAYIRKRHARS